MHRNIDLNADMAEGDDAVLSPVDRALLEVVTSANIACGFHAGSPTLMRAACRAAQDHGVRIGAHVSYHDRASFGRRELDLPADELCADVLYQLGALDAFGDIAHIKPHGALYNRVAWDERQAAAVVEAVLAYDDHLPVLGLPGSCLLKLAHEAGLPTIEEGFADRAYTNAGQLRPRSEPGAVLTDADAVARHALALAGSGRVRTLCVHGDTPSAVVLARSLRHALQSAGYTVAAFA